MKLTLIQEDALKEVAHIGASSASTALSKMTCRMIIVKTTKIEVMSIDHTASLFDGPNLDVVGVLFSVSGQIPGTMVSLTTKETSFELADMVCCNELGTPKALTPFVQDAIKEIGNILVGSYLAALSDMSGLNLLESVPDLMVGDTPAILKKALQTAKGAKDVIIIETCMVTEKKEFIDDMLLVLKPETLKKLMGAFVQ